MNIFALRYNPLVAARARRRHYVRWVAFSCVLLVVVAASAFFSIPQRAAAVTPDEAHVKAVFLYNLIHFFTWPEQTGAPVDTFIIGIVGDRNFAELVAGTVKGEEKGGVAIEVRYFDYVEEAMPVPSRILFVDKNQSEDWLQHRADFAGRPILFVGDSAGFAQRGGMVNLVTADRHIRIEINLEVVENAGLSVSAKLLSLATLIDS